MTREKFDPSGSPKGSGQQRRRREKALGRMPPVSRADTTPQLRGSLTQSSVGRTEATGTLAGATKTPTEAKRVSLEGSDRYEGLLNYEGLLKKLRKPWRQSIPNKPLEPWEREDIGDRLQKLTEQVTGMREELELNTEQLEAVTTTLREMHKEIREMHKEGGQIGRKDLVMLGITSLVTLGLSGLVPPAAVMSVMKMFLGAVAHLFGEVAAG